jgi:hypothetical protein
VPAALAVTTPELLFTEATLLFELTNAYGYEPPPAAKVVDWPTYRVVDDGEIFTDSGIPLTVIIDLAGDKA